MKKPAFYIDATEYLSNERVTLMTLAEEGAMFRAINEAAMRGDTKALAKYSFIGRYTMNDDTARPPIPKAVRQRVLSVGKCAHCGCTTKLVVDHVVPYSRGGAHDESNFQCLCQPCNSRKHNKMEHEL